MGEINARLIAGDLENEGIRTHIELEGSAWFYLADDPNQLAMIYVLAHDLDRAEAVLEEVSAGDAAIGHADIDPDMTTTTGASDDIVAEQERGLRWRPLRWAIAAVIVGALMYGFLEGSLREILR